MVSKQNHHSRNASAAEALDLVDRAPDDSRHSVFLLPKQLAVLGLSSWVSRLLEFLSHYDGLEPLMDPREAEPVVFTRQAILAEILQINNSEEEKDVCAIQLRLATAISEAAFTGLGACWRLQTDREDLPHLIAWNPLEQTWLEFLERAPAEINQYFLSVLSPSAYCAPSADIIRFLLA